MKTIRKIQINPENLMPNDELITLKGGYDGGACCTCTNGYAMAATSSSECEDYCNDLPGQHGVWRC